jgi:hypothetical protein
MTEEEYLDLMGRTSALENAFTGLVTILEEKHPELNSEVSALLTVLARRTGNEQIARALTDIVDSLAM